MLVHYDEHLLARILERDLTDGPLYPRLDLFERLGPARYRDAHIPVHEPPLEIPVRVAQQIVVFLPVPVPVVELAEVGVHFERYFEVVRIEPGGIERALEGARHYPVEPVLLHNGERVLRLIPADVAEREVCSADESPFEVPLGLAVAPEEYLRCFHIIAHDGFTGLPLDAAYDTGSFKQGYNIPKREKLAISD